MTTWRWPAPEVIYAIHDRQVAEHGSLDGLGNRTVVESALARPKSLAAGRLDEDELADWFRSRLA